MGACGSAAAQRACVPVSPHDGAAYEVEVVESLGLEPPRITRSPSSKAEAVESPGREPPKIMRSPSSKSGLTSPISSSSGKTLLEDMGSTVSNPDEIIPSLSKAKSAPVMLPSRAVRSRQDLFNERGASPDSAAPSPSDGDEEAGAAVLPAPRSPSTALAQSRRKKRRNVTFGEAQMREFRVD
mmetsp:Transcript_45564/g.117785  ORF Transcript_45564/g.117785 Transcript_45564/m.117785 type:complete len:183 (-) Transcript_45564:93-641(-)